MWMRTLRTISLLLLLTWLVPANRAFAQGPTPTTIVVASCGSPTLSAGTPYYITIDTTGKLCGITSGSTATANQGTAGTAAWPVMIGMGAYVTPYAGTSGMTTLGFGTTSNFTSTTTMVTAAGCVSLVSTATVVNITDGAGKYYAKNFSMPAFSILTLPHAIGQIFTSGIQASAGAANSISCAFNGVTQ